MRPVQVDDSDLYKNLKSSFATNKMRFRYVGTPIQCWMPTEFKGGWEQYAEDYCFIQNTFFIPFEEEIPNEDSDRTKVSENYKNKR